MNAPINTLAFARNFEAAGFDHAQASALAAATGRVHDVGSDDVVTRDIRKVELAELELRLLKEISAVGKDVSGRLWSTVTIIAGVSTAISATVGAGVALLLKAGGL